MYMEALRMQFRPLKADELEVRVGSVSKQGVTLLLYKNARVDMAVLDETVGAENWQRDHKEIKGNLYCGIGIKCGNEWVWKWDCGTESNTEKEKGEASDSFKRAAVNWGIGRELYSCPKIRVKCATKNRVDGDDSKGFVQVNKFEFYGAYVSDIDYFKDPESGVYTINNVTVKDQNGKVIFNG